MADADFPARTRADWQAAAAKALKARDPGELLTSTYDGLEVMPLYTAEDSEGAVFTPRSPAADPARPWDVRAIVDHPDSAEANRQALADLNGGAASLLLVLGDEGVAVGSRDDLARVLDGVLLDLAPVALDAGFAGPQAAEWLADLAKGAPRAPLSFHLDPLTAFALAGRNPGPLAAHLSRAAETAAAQAEAYPQASFFLASGRAVHEAAGSKAQELGFATAAAVAYARALADAGMPIGDAFSRIALGLSVDGEYFASLAKLRAARLIWARLLSACDLPDAPARIEARASRRDLAKVDAWTNLLRLTAAAFAGAVGGADAVVLEPFTRPLGEADAFARRQSRNIQLVLMEEAGLGRVDDPAAGSFYLDEHARELAEAGWCCFQKIEREGGAAQALRSGFVQTQVADVRARREAALQDGSAVLLGVTKFPDPNGRKPTLAEAPARSATAIAARLPGDDDACEPLTPVRLAQPYEGETA